MTRLSISILTSLLIEASSMDISQFVVGSPIGPNVRKAIDLISQDTIPSFAK